MSKTVQIPRSAPEAQGVSSAGILQFLEAVEKDVHEMHSLMLVRHGNVVAEGWWSPFKPEYPHMLYSLSKSFTSTAIGIAVAEGRLTVNDKVLDFFPEDAPKKVNEFLAQMRVKQLLSMSTGHDEDTTRYLHESKDGNWVRAFLERPVRFKPGTHFLYNTGATYMLSTILQKVTGMKLIDYLTPRLFEPLGIEGATWETCPRGINTGGYGLKVKTEDIAKFGQLYLQKGIWDGKCLVPESWIVEATSKQVSNGCDPDMDWDQGYGYQFWRCRHNIYRGDGAFGQYCIVMPDQDAVLAITSGLPDMQLVLNLVWKHLLPAMEQGKQKANPKVHQQLSEKLSSLELPEPEGKTSSPRMEAISGKTYQINANRMKIETVRFDFQGDETCVVTVGSPLGKQSVTCGMGKRVQDTSGLFIGASQRVEARAVWIAAEKLVLTIRYVESPHFFTITCRFTKQAVQLNGNVNVAFGPTRFPILSGRYE